MKAGKPELIRATAYYRAELRARPDWVKREDASFRMKPWEERALDQEMNKPCRFRSYERSLREFKA